MALIKSIKGKSPKWGDNCYLAENSTLIGDIEMGNDCSIWFSAVIRGDVNYVRMGNRVNVQDNATLHCTYQKYPLIIGNSVSIGHNAIVHGCTIKDRVLIGMGSIVMDNCVVESNSIVAAGAVVLEGTHIPSGSIFAGVPAKKVKDITPELLEGEIDRIAGNYLKYSSWLKEDDQ